jgi:hypothetical protein
MADAFANFASGFGGPASSGFAVTKSDVTVFAQPTRSLWIGGVGDVPVRMLDGTALTFTAVPAGTLLNVRVDKVMSAGTSATNIVGLY